MSYPKTNPLVEFLKKPSAGFTNLMDKMFHTHDWQPYLESKSGEYKTDSDVYNILCKWWHRPDHQPLPQEQINEWRGRARIKQFKHIFDILGVAPLQRGQKYLDFGAADGTISRAIGKYFKLNTYATDIPIWHGKARPEESSRFYVSENLTGKELKIPFGAQKFDLISCLMVLHHVPDPKKCILDIKSRLAPKALLVIREHDAFGDEIKNLCHIEHAIHDIVFDRRGWGEFTKDYYAVYESMMYWKELFKSCGFQCDYADLPDGATKYGYLCFRLA
jgi:2-polyprenyl-3-methyl-5-hydroxy-6-metoxy-1,4-benzoquinol methylase